MGFWWLDFTNRIKLILHGGSGKDWTDFLAIGFPFGPGARPENEIFVNKKEKKKKKKQKQNKKE